jgi:hypothetical protein
MDQLIDQNTGKVKWESIDLDLERFGEKIILPADPGPMEIPDAIAQLKRIMEAENTVYDVAETIDGHFFDAIVAFTRAIKEKYGFSQATHTTVQGFFGKMKNPPRLLHIRTGPAHGDFIQVPFGAMKFPNISGTLETKFGLKNNIPALVIAGEVKAKERNIVLEIVQLANKYVREQSIYRGRSVIIERDERNNGIDVDNPLQFFDPFSGSEVPIFNKDTEELIRTAVMAPLEFSKQCRDNNIPLKRGILFEGPYGCGKTLVSREVARVANENGWTFMLVKEASSLRHALNFARMYQPCVVFSEDIDQVVGDRNEKANSLLNDIDGVVGKNDEIVVVLTSNFADKIDKAFLRPGRLDAVVSIRPPEPEAVDRLIRYYAGDLLDPKADVKDAAELMAGNIPAQIREVVERSKLAMLANGRKKIDGPDLKVSALSMKNHNDLLAKASEGIRKVDPMSEIIGDLVRKNTKDILNEAGLI